MLRYAVIASTVAACLILAGCENPAQRCNKSGLEAYIRVDYREALGAFTMAIEHSPQTPEYYFNRGACYQALGRLDLAIDDYNIATQMGPGITAAWEQLAACHLALGMPEKALETLENACRANPYNARPYIALANFYKARGDLKQAELWFAKAVASDPESAEAHRQYGKLLMRVGKEEEGLKEYRKSLTLKPDQPELSAEVTTISPTGDQLPPPKPLTD